MFREFPCLLQVPGASFSLPSGAYAVARARVGGGAWIGPVVARSSGGTAMSDFLQKWRIVWQNMVTLDTTKHA